ncbi:hypothetical protein LCGC14_1995970, partial [marine sediment metagenome]
MRPTLLQRSLIGAAVAIGVVMAPGVVARTAIEVLSVEPVGEPAALPPAPIAAPPIETPLKSRPDEPQPDT